MALKPTKPADLTRKITALDTNDISALSRISAMETDSEDFGAILAENPQLALAAKGIAIDAEQALKIQDQLKAAARGPGDLAADEIGVTVKHKF